MEQAVIERAADAATTAAPRYDIYAFVHKGLRTWMGELLNRLGRTDPTDAAEVGAALDSLRDLLAFCRSHIAHEDDFIHAAMEARRPGSAAHTASDHLAHETAIRELEGIVGSLEYGPAATRTATLQRLYRAFAVFVAENLEHMSVEESHNNLVLWETHTDAEIMAIEHALVASIPPAEMMGTLRRMLPAMNALERAAMLGGMRQGMPAEAFGAVLTMLEPLLSPADWHKVDTALGL